MKKHLCLTYLILVFLIGLQSAPARVPRTTNVTLRWSRNPEPDIAKYKVYYGMASGDYTPVTTVTNPTATITVRNGTVAYIAVTAVNTAGLESPFSAEVQWP